MGWLIAMFDLPVMTDKERKVATRFRKDLLDHGFLMIQFSVYARPCVSFEQVDKHLGIIEKMVPAAGNVRLLFITDEQWSKSVTVIGPNYDQGKHAKDPKVPDQVEFWD
ncbi:MAG: CRISPR-associated endonuclease Cas2 [Chloroflexi bacterium]|nr:CRISPR-associated endonuclease Cas2 [Chloroflexota bacterium]